MWKKALAGAAALTIASSALVYAQQRPGGPDAREPWRATAEDMSAFTDARIAALKAGLRLTPDQDKNWPAFEQAFRDLAKLRMDRFAALRDQQPPRNMIEGLQRRADALTARGAALKRLADAAAPLYESLDQGQKRRFALLARPVGPQHMQHHEHWRGHRDPGGHGGYRGDGDFRGPSGTRDLRGDGDDRGPL